VDFITVSLIASGALLGWLTINSATTGRFSFLVASGTLLVAITGLFGQGIAEVVGGILLGVGLGLLYQVLYVVERNYLPATSLDSVLFTSEPGWLILYMQGNKELIGWLEVADEEGITLKWPAWITSSRTIPVANDKATIWVKLSTIENIIRFPEVKSAEEEEPNKAFGEVQDWIKKNS